MSKSASQGIPATLTLNIAVVPALHRVPLKREFSFAPFPRHHCGSLSFSSCVELSSAVSPSTSLLHLCSPLGLSLGNNVIPDYHCSDDGCWSVPTSCHFLLYWPAPPSRATSFSILERLALGPVATAHSAPLPRVNRLVRSSPLTTRLDRLNAQNYRHSRALAVVRASGLALLSLDPV